MHEEKISVRHLVEFIFASGDLTSSSAVKDPEAMQEGTRIHKKLQKQNPISYKSEVLLRHSTSLSIANQELLITVEGRADGIFPGTTQSIAGTTQFIPTVENEDNNGMAIDEIKGVYRDIHSLEKPQYVHKAQAMCYAYIYLQNADLDGMWVRLTYCHIPTEEVRYFSEYFSREFLEEWYDNLMQEFGKWIAWQQNHRQNRNQSIAPLEFPFPFRQGQGELTKNVYQSILRKKRLYVQAPTGVGKTMATLFPSVKAMEQGLVDKLFYLTAKTITRKVAEQAFSLLNSRGGKLLYVTLTAKDKICILEKSNCNPQVCPRAKGHFDRINDAVFDLLQQESAITRDLILEYADKHQVCPFEMSLDISLWTDAVICDYNYAFDPTSHLKRFFQSEGPTNPYLFLIDEAHNLVDRAREMYSALLIKENFLATKKITKKYSKKVTNSLDSCNRALLELKRKCGEILHLRPSEIDSFFGRLLRLSSIYDEFLQEIPSREVPIPMEDADVILDFYFKIREFIGIYELLDDKYLIFADYNESNEFVLHLQCMDPSSNLDYYLSKVRSGIFFSATLLPVRYYMEQLAGGEDDYAVYAPSPFDKTNRLLIVGRQVSTKYTKRSPDMFRRIADYLNAFVAAKQGNYLFFFPSYYLLQQIKEYLNTQNISYLTQETSMSEEEREGFLSAFENNSSSTLVGLCVLGGIFGEGIDLKNDSLIGAAIIGTGLPMVCNENELFRQYFNAKDKDGFAYAYRYPGMNKVLQAAGRVIRTDTDRGAILLLDDRFLEREYQSLFPKEWFPYEVLSIDGMKRKLSNFWTEDE